MSNRSTETIGVRYTAWAALNRDPQDDRVEYTCPHCGTPGNKLARRTREEYHFTDGFLQDVQGEMSSCRVCRKSLRIVPVVLVHDMDEKQRFEAVYTGDLALSHN